MHTRRSTNWTAFDSLRFTAHRGRIKILPLEGSEPLRAVLVKMADCNASMSVQIKRSSVMALKTVENVSSIDILRRMKVVYDMKYLLTAIGLSRGGSSTVHIYTQTIHRTTQNKQYIEQHKNFGRMRAMSRLCELYPGICLTTEEKARKNLSQGSRIVPAGKMKIYKSYKKNT